MEKRKASKEIEKHLDEWERWLVKIKNSSLNKLLDEKLRELEPDRGLDAVPELKTSILGHCFCCAEPDKIPGANWSSQLKDEDKRFIEYAESALNNINELSIFIRKHSAPHQAPDIDLLNALAKYASNVEYLIIKLKEKAFAHWRQYGALYYPKTLTPQAQREFPQLNSILFSVVFLIRQYTDQNVSGENWLEKKAGPMPPNGNPNYELTAQIVNATNELSNHQFLKKPLTGDQVKYRIKRLVDNDVNLSIWIAPQHLPFLDGNRIPLK